jgi:hypothetical protein
MEYQRYSEDLSIFKRQHESRISFSGIAEKYWKRWLNVWIVGRHNMYRRSSIIVGSIVTSAIPWSLIHLKSGTHHRCLISNRLEPVFHSLECVSRRLTQNIYQFCRSEVQMSVSLYLFWIYFACHISWIRLKLNWETMRNSWFCSWFWFWSMFENKCTTFGWQGWGRSPRDR